jgi:hypothetical protein
MKLAVVSQEIVSREESRVTRVVCVSDADVFVDVGEFRPQTLDHYPTAKNKFAQGPTLAQAPSSKGWTPPRSPTDPCDRGRPSTNSVQKITPP